MRQSESRFESRIRARTIIDTLTRLSPPVDVCTNYRGKDDVEALERGAADFEHPRIGHTGFGNKAPMDDAFINSHSQLQ